jgi:hypothetical protein
MAEKIWLFHEPRTGRGPGMVAKNLKLGLNEIGVEVVKRPSRANYIGCLQNPGQFFDMLPEHTLMGPNLFVLPPEAPHLCEKFKNFVVPSQWVRNKYLTYPSLRKKNIQVWPVGINTVEWTPAKEPPKFDCFIYYKDQPWDVVDAVMKQLKDRGLTYCSVLKYGDYNENELKEACAVSKFAILATNTESQGIAYMQILSTGTPCFVLNQTVWTYQGSLPSEQGVSAAASSVPYFDSRCGRITNASKFDHSKFNLFVDNVDKNLYAPRDYILEHHTLSISARRYMEIIRKGASKS